MQSKKEWFTTPNSWRVETILVCEILPLECDVKAFFHSTPCSKIDTFKRHFSFYGQEGLQEPKKIVVRIEEKDAVYTSSEFV